MARGEASHPVLDAIFKYCYSIWGGRFSLIVPCDGGTPVNVPDECFVPALNVAGSMMPDDNPMSALQGKDSKIPAIDIAMVNTRALAPTVKPPHTLPVRFRDWTPRVGDYVLAVGFPQLDITLLDEEQKSALLEEGMFAAYGRIIDVLDKGRSTTNPTPVIEVEANWPAGMSGGPVFNQEGDVVGLVSRSLPADGDSTGTGYAVYFSGVADMDHFAPWLDRRNPGWRLGWGVITGQPERVVSFYKHSADAEAFQKTFPERSRVVALSHRIGTLEYMAAR